MRLFIAEKKELATVIAENLNIVSKEHNCYICEDDNIVVWCYGHLLKLTDPEDYDESLKLWKFNTLPLKWEIEFKKDPKHSDLIDYIGRKIKEADEIVNAGDPDEEGQFLIDELLEFFNNTKPVKRLLINDNTDALVKKALNNMSDNNNFRPMYHSALARAVSDQRFGYNMTRIYTLLNQFKYSSNEVFSIGRVQTPILNMICNRFLENKNHKKIEYYELLAQFECLDKNLKFNAKLESDSKFLKKSDVEDIKQFCLKKNAEILSIDRKIKYKDPELPFNLLALQMRANELYGYSAENTLKVTQALRDKYKLITYNRTDSRYLSDEKHLESKVMLELLKDNLNIAPIIKEADPTIKSKAFNSKNVTAHHAIIPTETRLTEDMQLTKQEFNIYKLISYQYIIQFFKPYKYESTILKLGIEDYVFKADSQKVLDLGWKKIITEKNDNEIDEELNSFKNNFDNLTEKNTARLEDAEVLSKTTKPNPLYTEATLLGDLKNIAKYVKNEKIKKLLLEKDKNKVNENGGIGTPATRSAIIENLKIRNFIEEKNKKIIPTDKGLSFIDSLPPEIKNPDLTALWHEKQEKIREGNLNLTNFISEVESYIERQVSKVKDEINSTTQICPKCGSFLVKRQSKKDKSKFFYGCSNYPKCDYIKTNSKNRTKNKEALLKTN